jgi:uncharacterized protein YecE (DUF72 family)
MARVLIGTSGWHYDSWRGPFFPKGLPLKSQLQFQSVFVCGVEWRLLPDSTPEAVESWRFQTGKDFVFAWKASKFITHWKRLSESSANSLELLEDLAWKQSRPDPFSASTELPGGRRSAR